MAIFILRYLMALLFSPNNKSNLVNIAVLNFNDSLFIGVLFWLVLVAISPLLVVFVCAWCWRLVLSKDVQSKERRTRDLWAGKSLDREMDTHKGDRPLLLYSLLITTYLRGIFLLRTRFQSLVCTKACMLNTTQ